MSYDCIDSLIKIIQSSTWPSLELTYTNISLVICEFIHHIITLIYSTTVPAQCEHYVIPTPLNATWAPPPHDSYACPHESLPLLPPPPLARLPPPFLRRVALEPRRLSSHHGPLHACHLHPSPLPLLPILISLTQSSAGSQRIGFPCGAVNPQSGDRVHMHREDCARFSLANAVIMQACVRVSPWPRKATWSSFRRSTTRSARWASDLILSGQRQLMRMALIGIGYCVNFWCLMVYFWFCWVAGAAATGDASSAAQWHTGVA
jgi:hypothetical protein